MDKMLKNVKIRLQVFNSQLIYFCSSNNYIILIGSPKAERANQPTYTKAQLDTVKK